MILIAIFPYYPHKNGLIISNYGLSRIKMHLKKDLPSYRLSVFAVKPSFLGVIKNFGINFTPIINVNLIEWRF